MIVEALDHLKATYEAASSLKTVSVETNDPSKARLYNHRDGNITELAVKPPPRLHKPSTIKSFADAFSRYEDGNAAVWVTMTVVKAVLDDGSDEYRKSALELAVTPSPLFVALTRIPSEQKPLVIAIRHDLRPAEIIPESFALAIAALKWETTDVAEGAVGTVKTTMGRQINAQVSGASDIPPEITVTFEPFPALANELQATVSVVCSVMTDPAERKIIVRPYPGQIEQAQAEAVEKLRARIASAINDDGKRVFAGTP